MENILQLLDQSKELITGIVSVILLIIISWKQIKEELAREVESAKTELYNIVKGLIISVDEKQNEVLRSLVNKEDIDTDSAKESIVIRVLQERHYKLLKRAKLKTTLDISYFVENVYQGTKPYIKILRNQK